jgi:hypothetical protein
VERVNRTLKDLLKSQTNSVNSWGKCLRKVVSIYNHTFHSEIKTSPSDFVLTQINTSANDALVQSVRDYWSEGNPSFLPYRVGQKVCRKILYQSRETRIKLSDVYDGPYIILKVQPNGLSYEIRPVTLDGVESVKRVHYTQLKIWREPPKYLRS